MWNNNHKFARINKDLNLKKTSLKILAGYGYAIISNLFRFDPAGAWAHNLTSEKLRSANTLSRKVEPLWGLMSSKEDDQNGFKPIPNCL